LKFLRLGVGGLGDIWAHVDVVGCRYIFQTSKIAKQRAWFFYLM
jgi:hypothetical protein